MAPRLTLVPVGVGAAYSRPGEAQSSHLVRAGERAYLVDMGSGAFSNLLGLVERPHELDGVFITHRHPDHCVDLIAFCVWMAWGPGAGHRVRVVGPPGLRDRLGAFANEPWDECFAFEEWAPGGGAIDLGDGLVLTHREVPHVAPTNAVRFDRGGASVCYGADCAPGPELPALAAGCDVLLCECTFGVGPVPDGVPHLDAEGAGRAAAAAAAKRLLLTHSYPDVDRDAALRIVRRHYGGPASWARQGEEVAL
ncbi:MAG: MBL fold metallo-hydrolase [Thermoleophilia bacterium]